MRQVLANRTIRTIAGVYGNSTYSGEGKLGLLLLGAAPSSHRLRPAMAAGLPWWNTRLSFPAAVTAYLGGFLVSNRGSCRVTMLWANGSASTVAGNGTCGGSGTGGAATLASIALNLGGIGIDTTPPAAGGAGGWFMAEQVRADGLQWWRARSAVPPPLPPTADEQRRAPRGSERPPLARSRRGVGRDDRCVREAGSDSRTLMRWHVTPPPFAAGDGGAATQAQLSGPSAVASDGAGGLYIAGALHSASKKM